MLALRGCAETGAAAVQTGSCGANRLGFDVGEFVHINLGQSDEGYAVTQT